MPIFPGLNHVLMKRFLRIFLAVALLCVATDALAQRLSGSNYATVGYVKSDGTIQDSSYRTIGHASGVKREWAAFCFFFF